MKKHALLLRMNPRHWPIWGQKLKAECGTDVWFTTGRRRPQDITNGIPVVVLGTQNLGVVAYGTTSSSVEWRPNPDWKESPLKYQEEGKKPKNRVCVNIKRIQVDLDRIKQQPQIGNLYRTARETATWLTEDQYQEFASLM